MCRNRVNRECGTQCNNLDPLCVRAHSTPWSARSSVPRQPEAESRQLIEELVHPAGDPLLVQVDLVLEIEGETYKLVAALAPRGGVEVALRGPSTYEVGAVYLSLIGEDSDRVLVGVVVEDLVPRPEKGDQLALQVELRERVELLPPRGLELTYVPGAAADDDEVELEHEREVKARDVVDGQLHASFAAHLPGDQLGSIPGVAQGAAYEHSRPQRSCSVHGHRLTLHRGITRCVPAQGLPCPDEGRSLNISGARARHRDWHRNGPPVDWCRPGHHFRGCLQFGQRQCQKGGRNGG